MVDYALQFREHLSQFRAHLSGSHDKHLSPSFVPIGNDWSPEEKDLFFHGITVHSRFRPDLISADIGTKNIIDVCVYTDMLDKASAMDPSNVQLREELEGALEVSDSLIGWEEEQASALVDNQWTDPLCADDVTLDAVMSRLDRHYLKAMESILRSVDSTLTERDGAIVQPNSDDNEVRHLSETQAVPDSHLPIVSAPPGQASRVVDDGDVPPTHRAPDGAVDGVFGSNFVLRQASGADRLSPEPSNIPVHEDAQLFIAKKDKEGGANPRIRELSPASRRRQQKRLYMRRKRAEARGETVNNAVERLRPGRKLKTRVQKKGRPKAYNTKKRRLLQEEIIDSDFEDDEGDENDRSIRSPAPPENTSELPPAHDETVYAHPRSGGVTKANKVKSLLARCGLTRHGLEDAGLEFFNLSRLSRLLESSDSPVEAISAETIRLLKAVVVEFVTEVLHRSMILFEQDIRMKGDIKVWRSRPNKELSVDHVERAVEMTGVNSNWYSSSEASNMSDSETNLSSHGDSNSEEQVTTKPASTLHRQLYSPLIVLPNSRVNPAQPKQHPNQEDELIPLDTDEDALMQELEDEEYIDRRDSMVASSYEEDLWNQIRN
ncbi:hypothetical protein BDN72DRAFT_832296, partial [Pluteus cervinus]